MNVKIFSYHDFEADYYPAEKQGLVFSRTYDRLTAETCRQAEGHQAVCLFTSDDASGPVLEQLHEMGVKFLALRSAGYNHADLTKAAALGIKVANVPAYSPYA
ncbi:MAG TPA: hypothetical protein VK927_02070, partial [Adhaeribacter sp.]|nr:hypothetical protein [Adhaeribacter sp.]